MVYCEEVCGGSCHPHRLSKQTKRMLMCSRLYFIQCWELNNSVLTSSSTDLHLRPLLQKTLPLSLTPSRTHILSHSQCVSGIVGRWIGRCLPVGCPVSVQCKHLWILLCIP